MEFLFSVPTTWQIPVTIAHTEKLLRQAGFGTELKHIVKVSLTEAEAAAVYVAKQSYQIGDILLVCDAGGGTTDINALRVKDNRAFRTELEPLLSVQGEAVGSTLIDFRVEAIIAEWLEDVADLLDETPKQVAGSMLNASRHFDSFKCSFGSDLENETDLFLPVSGLPPGLDYPAAHIQNSMVVITR